MLRTWDSSVIGAQADERDRPIVDVLARAAGATLARLSTVGLWDADKRTEILGCIRALEGAHRLGSHTCSQSRVFVHLELYRWEEGGRVSMGECDSLRTVCTMNQWLCEGADQSADQWGRVL